MVFSHALICFLAIVCINGITSTARGNGLSGSTISPSFLSSSQWAINKIELDKAWDISTGSSDVLVGVIDSGIRGTHEDLSSNINTSLSTVVSNVYTTTLEDVHGHGTHVAGIIGANGANVEGIAGVCWNVSLVDLRAGYIYGDSSIILNTELQSLIGYAGDAAHGIGLLNFSYYNAPYDSNVANAIQSYPGLFVCIAGNGSKYINATTSTDYPASYHFDNMIVVGNSDENDNKYSTSNFGTTVVDIFAPGTAIKSTYYSHNSSYCDMTGTSMAAPYVTGTAALLKSINPTLTPSQIKAAILNNADHITALEPYVTGGKRLNAYKAALAVLPTYTNSQTIYSPCSIPVSGHQWYKINALPNYCSFRNTSTMNLTASLFSDIQGTPLAVGSSNGSGLMFTYNFTSSGTYYLKIVNNSSSSGNYSISITNPHIHNYGEPYVWKNTAKHFATCDCGQTTLQAHVVQSGTNTCLLCHGTASGGFIGPDAIGQPILNDSNIYPNGIIALGIIDYSNYCNGFLSLEEIYEGALYE